MLKRSLVVLALLLMTGSLAMGSIAFAQEETPEEEPAIDLTDHEEVLTQILDNLLIPTEDTRARAAELIELVGTSEDLRYAAPLLDIGYFTRTSLSTTNSAIFGALLQLTGETFTSWQGYFEWASANDLPLPDGYDTFKGNLLGVLIDPRFADFFEDVQDTAQVNLLEAVWGGVRVDGIPSLVNARQITPEEALEEGEALQQFCRADDCSYPAPDELVFGLSINGDARAYPLRQLNWHEMFNDVVGHAPMYDAPNGELICNFRAPTNFRAVGRSGDDFIQIHGDSAGCPREGGWLGDPETIVWASGTWEEVRDLLPDLAEADAEPLDFTSGVSGHVEGTPVMLAYCTLCGSGILYSPIIPASALDPEAEGEAVLEFGSTGMLMRSNKLMYDRTTNTVWNAITGTVAFGPLAGQELELERLPVVVTDWATWLEEHPDTSVLSLVTGFQRDYTNGGAYSDYFNDPEFIMFPVWQQDTTEQENKDVIFALNLDSTPKAYPLANIIPEGVTNDTLAGTDLVIVSRETPEREFFEPGGASVRAYERGGFTFSPGEDHTQVIDQNGDVWDVTEDALIGPDDAMLERLPGHLAFWFGWFSFYPETLVYEGEMSQ